MGQMGQNSGNRRDVFSEVIRLALRLRCSGILRDLSGGCVDLYPSMAADANDSVTIATRHVLPWIVSSSAFVRKQ